MAEGSNLTAEISYDKIPVADGVRDYISQRISPDATTRNWNSYGDKVKFEKGINVMEAFTLLPDPQTNGGLLVSVKQTDVDLVRKILSLQDPIGKFVSKGERLVIVTP
jgi:selenide,water dikinase